MKPVGAVLVLLVVLLLVLTALLIYRNHHEEANGTRVEYRDQTYPLSGLTLPSIMNVTGRDGKSYSGVPVAGILSACGINLPDVAKLTLHTFDGGSVVIQAVDLNKLFLAEETAGDWRLIVPSDEFKQRWLKHIARIVVE